jgi:phosphate:Na+ symporter
MTPELALAIKTIGLAIAGLALFLYGLDHFAAQASAMASDRMRRVLASLTRNRILGTATGSVTTALLQSSTSVSVIVVGLIEAGTMSFRQAIPVLVGANIGTTITTQLVAFKVTEWGGVILAVGFLLSLLHGRAKNAGKLAFYFGFVFFGLSILADQMAPVASQPWVRDGLRLITDPYTFVAAGLVLTAIVQSSSVVTGLAVIMLQADILSFEASVGLVIGSNAGTTITTWLASHGKSLDARRAAWAHILFNVGGVLLFLPLVSLYAHGLSNIPIPESAQLASGHALFNIATAVLALVLLKQFTKLVERVVPR